MTRHRSKQPVAIDLFCGSCGLSEGLRQSRFRVIGGVELDELACKTYKLNHKKTMLWKTDIRRLSGAAIMKRLKLTKGELDLLAACPPCQGFSSMRTKNGSLRNRDARNDLIFEVLRMVRSLGPKTVMLENVPGLVKNRRFVEFCSALSDLGYHVKWAVLNTMDFGVPQRRRRLILLASKYAEPDFAPKSGSHRTVREFIGHLPVPKLSDDPLHNYDVVRSEKFEELIRKIPPNGGSRKSLGTKNQLPCHQRQQGFWDVYGRMAWDKPSPTITGGCINPSKGRFLHPRSHRAITLREAALLQTFPQRYRFSLDNGRFPAALLIGNALPPEFIRRHANALKKSAFQSRRDSGT